MTLSLAALDVAEVATQVTNPHTVDELTTVSITGTGVFDVMMRSAKLHLKEEYDSRRITGKEYAQVYLGMITAVMQQSVAFILQQEQLAKTRAEIALLRQKTVTELAQTDDLIPAGLGFNDSTAVEGSVAKQKALYTAQTEGFSRDAEQKLAKIMTEVWSVQRSTDEGMTVPSTLDNASIDVVLTKAAAGIGVTAL